MVQKKRFDFGKLQINMTNRWLYTLIAFFGIMILAVGVYALGSTPNPGHDIDELQTCDNNNEVLKMANGNWECSVDAVGNIQTCADGGILKMSGGAWACGTDATGSGGEGSLWSESGSNIYYSLGNVGIGTTNPESKLDIRGAARIEAVSPALELKTTTTSKVWSIQNYGSFYILEGSDTRMTFLPGGNVGIGTTNPGAKLEVNGDLKVNGELYLGSDGTSKPVILPTVVGTTGSYTGGEVGGYSDTICNSAFGATYGWGKVRMATADDFLNGLEVPDSTASAWYSRYTKWTYEPDNPSEYNDCSGWSWPTDSDKGYYWSTSTNGPATSNCNYEFPILCVKFQ